MERGGGAVKLYSKCGLSIQNGRPLTSAQDINSILKTLVTFGALFSATLFPQSHVKIKITN